MPNKQAGYLLDLLESAQVIRDYVRGFDRDSFLRDARTQDAVLRRLLVMGEAAGRITQKTRDVLPAIPFHQIAGTRHRVVHDYRNIDAELIWRTISSDLPSLIDELQHYFDSLADYDVGPET